MNHISQILSKKEETQRCILNFFDDENDESAFSFRYLNGLQDHAKIKATLYLLSKISNNRHRSSQFFIKIEKILQYMKNSIKKYLSNSEIFNIFKSNKKCLLILFKNKILIPNKKIAETFFKQKYKDLNYPNYFLPEIKQTSYSKKLISAIEKENKKYFPDNVDFELLRNIGENHFYLSQLIRNDLIDIFISYTTKEKIGLNAKIERSIFETNSFLLKQENQISMIEYAMFFGSIRIIKYLYLNGVKLKPSLWLFAIHSNNADIIHFLEDVSIEIPESFIHDIFVESLKCHHLEITSYLLDCSNQVNYFFEADLVKSIKYMNFAFYPNDLKSSLSIFYLCKYDLVDIVKFFLNENNVDIFFYVLDNFIFK